VSRQGKLRRIPRAVKSPWFWPVVPLLAVAAVGQWVGLTAAAAVAGVTGAGAIGIGIGLALAGERLVAQRSQAESPPGTKLSRAYPGGTPKGDVLESHADPARIVDLRGARLINALLVSADLRHADLRGAILTGADLSGADLTGARLGPLDDK
jgi:Pentapeptide repeats (8 copies)